MILFARSKYYLPHVCVLQRQQAQQTIVLPAPTPQLAQSGSINTQAPSPDNVKVVKIKKDTENTFGA